jgi:hypothetical protein
MSKAKYIDPADKGCAVISRKKLKQAVASYYTEERVRPRYAAAGDKNNEQITNCRICAANGWPREPIDFVKVNGRMRSDGTYEAAYWKLKNYYTGQPHSHKETREGLLK